MSDVTFQGRPWRTKLLTRYAQQVQQFVIPGEQKSSPRDVPGGQILLIRDVPGGQILLIRDVPGGQILLIRDVPDVLQVRVLTRELKYQLLLRVRNQAVDCG